MAAFLDKKFFAKTDTHADAVSSQDMLAKVNRRRPKGLCMQALPRQARAGR
jgi:hypothetical protein